MVDIINLTPAQIVAELDRYIIGQKSAKKAVANALRNRWRRRRVQKPLGDEIMPKNILMIGSTGVGKTEIARRLAKLSNSPFIKVEATKFTEIGYVGRDVDSIIRDLTEISYNMVRKEMREEVMQKAKALAEERIIDTIVGTDASEDTRAKFKQKLRNGELDASEIEIEVKDTPNAGTQAFEIPGMPGAQMGVFNLADIINKVVGGKTKLKRMLVPEAMQNIINDESDKLIDEELIIRKTIECVENTGIVFIDEIDKITGRSEARGGEVSREGVQRDLLPLIEGTTVSTKYGSVNTDHILFIASGAFHMARPSDLLPELQGRLPIRVELESLTEADLERILTEPEASLLKQYSALLGVENVDLSFSKDGVKAIASMAAEVNRNVENIGARRLHTIIEKLLEDVSFEADSLGGQKIIVNEKYVSEHLSNMVKNADLSKFIL